VTEETLTALWMDSGEVTSRARVSIPRYFRRVILERLRAVSKTWRLFPWNSLPRHPDASSGATSNQDGGFASNDSGGFRRYERRSALWNIAGRQSSV